MGLMGEGRDGNNRCQWGRWSNESMTRHYRKGGREGEPRKQERASSAAGKEFNAADVTTKDFATSDADSTRNDDNVHGASHLWFPFSRLTRGRDSTIKRGSFGGHHKKLPRNMKQTTRRQWVTGWKGDSKTKSIVASHTDTSKMQNTKFNQSMCCFIVNKLAYHNI